MKADRNSKLSLAASLSLLVIIVFSGCAAFKSPVTGYDTPYVKIIIKPDVEKLRGSSIGVFDFSSSDQSQGLGRSIAQNTHKYLLKYKFMRLVELARICPAGIENAIEIGRSKGCDLILLGHVDEFLYGGLNTNSKVSISIRVIDVRTKVTLWYITGRMEGRYEEHSDYILFTKDTREAPPPRILCAKVMRELLGVLTER